MKQLVAAVTARGQVAIPSLVRRTLGIKPLGKVTFVIDHAEVRLIPTQFTLEAQDALAPRAALAALLALMTAWSACAPQPAPTRSGDRVAAPPPQEAPTRAPKILTLAIQNELKGFVVDLSLENARVGGVMQPKPVVHNLLTVENEKGQWLPELAAEPLSVERGTWQLNPNGTMDTTWKIRANARWQDGTPFTSDDLLFTFAVFTDPDVPNQVGPAARLMVAATAPDPLTLAVSWSSPFVTADRAPGLVPLPRHLLEDTYRADKANLASSPRLSTEFVGLGPYKLTRWEPGSHMELVRFDDYWRGRPPLDRVVVRFLADANTMVANILSEAVDVVLAPAVDLEGALDVRQRWEGTGHQVLVGPSGAIRDLVAQQRPELARPRNGLPNATVRRALYHAIDRSTMADVLTQGLAPIADSWYSPSDPLRPQIEASIPQYPYDLRRAQQLLAQAGWVRGTDGALVHQQTGERFEVQLSGTTQRRVERETNSIADGWKATGVQVAFYAIPPPLANSNETLSTQPGATTFTHSVDSYLSTTISSRYIPSPQNRWNGGNTGGYSSPRVDDLIDRLSLTIAPSERVALERALVQEAMGDVPNWLLYWDMTHVLALRGVKGIASGGGRYHTWNFFEWDKD